jgi:hypothetical protein
MFIYKLASDCWPAEFVDECIYGTLEIAKNRLDKIIKSRENNGEGIRIEQYEVYFHDKIVSPKVVHHHKVNNLK